MDEGNRTRIELLLLHTPDVLVLYTWHSRVHVYVISVTVFKLMF